MNKLQKNRQKIYDDIISQSNKFTPEMLPLTQLFTKKIIDDLKKKEELTERDEEMINRGSMFGGAICTTWLANYTINRQRRKIRNLLFLQLISLIALLTLGAYFGFNIDLKIFKAFMVLWIPTTIATVLSLLKAFKIWSESKRNLAEAMKAETEAYKIRMETEKS